MVFGGAAAGGVRGRLAGLGRPRSKEARRLRQLEAGTGEQDTSKYAETMEELEQLMARLEDVFQSFRYTRKPTTEELTCI